MTDTPTPPMTPEQRAVLVAELRLPWFTNGCEWYQVRAANSLEADGVTITTLTAERDAAEFRETMAANKAVEYLERAEAAEAAQDRAYSLAVAIMGGEDAPGLADSLPTETLETLARSNFRQHSEDVDRLTAAQAEIARLTAALATAREDGMREAAALIKPNYARPCDCSGCYCRNIDSAQEVASWDSDNAAAKTIEAAIQKGAAT